MQFSDLCATEGAQLYQRRNARAGALVFGKSEVGFSAGFVVMLHLLYYERSEAKLFHPFAGLGQVGNPEKYNFAFRVC